MVRALLASILVCAFTTPHAQEIKCKVTAKYVCESGGCKSLPAKVWNIIDQVKRTYARCDSAGCDNYDAQITQSDAFINIEIPARGVIAKMALDGSTFHEVATLMHVVYVSFGSCKH